MSTKENEHRRRGGLSSRGRVWATLCSVRTGILLLILVVIASAAGTFVLQRPQTDPRQLQRAYEPGTLRFLDALGLTDVFHAWWFAVLLALFCLSIVFASLDRLPTAWRYFSRPYRRPESHFWSGLGLHEEIPIRGERSGLEAAERAFRALKLKPQVIANSGGYSLFAERNRASRLAAYVVHLSLLLIIGGGLADALWGYRGYLALSRGEQSNEIQMRDGSRRELPFAVRCDGAGQENYADGSPRRWWSRLVVLEAGREVNRTEIEVNQPLVYSGVRFYQSGYGSTGELDWVVLRATSRSDPANTREITLRPGQPFALDADTSVSLLAFLPDFVLQGDHILSRSDQPNNPAIQLEVTSSSNSRGARLVSPQTTKVWIFPKFPGFAHPDAAPYAFEYRTLEMAYFTGLQVAHEPGQWAVWAGVILMGIGLAMAFYFIHMRFWAMPMSDDRGRLTLWVGASAAKQRDEFRELFQRLVEEIAKNVGTQATVPAMATATPIRPSQAASVASK
jgi:cytochrome c biogenesis protein